MVELSITSIDSKSRVGDIKKRELSFNEMMGQKKKLQLSEEFDDIKFPNISNAKHFNKNKPYEDELEDPNIRSKSINDR